MSSKIKELARKKLWALSAGRCAICGVELIYNDCNSNIGQECHIVSPRPNGPRHQSNLEDYDNYDNFILLCANHHREIDTNVDSYPVSTLKRIKRDHECRIEKNLNEEKVRIDVLTKVDSGDDLGKLIWGNHGHTVIPNSKDSTINKIAIELDELIGNMMDMQDFLQLSDKLAFHQDLDNYIERICKLNYGLYADIQVKSIKGVRFTSLRIIINNGTSDVLLLKCQL
ncbi:MAG: HNH endonuclease [Prevotella sp.]|nr:HNH endonuclease [Prevotella sp.]